MFYNKMVVWPRSYSEENVLRYLWDMSFFLLFKKDLLNSLKKVDQTSNLGCNQEFTSKRLFYKSVTI